MQQLTVSIKLHLMKLIVVISVEVVCESFMSRNRMWCFIMKFDEFPSVPVILKLIIHS